MQPRKAQIKRDTGETKIRLSLNIDGKGKSKIATGIPFFDHMLILFAKHATVDLNLRCNGDIEVDHHHTVEDCGIALGQELPSDEPLDAKRLAKQIRESIVVLTQFGRDDNEEGVGTGFVVSADGLIATSLHGIGEGRPVQVRLANGEELEVTAVHAWDRTLDLALLRVNKTGLKPLPIGDSSALSQGSPVVAMGTPHGLDFSFVQGVLSARRSFESVEMLQLALPIEPGNSGGPLLDLHGRVHGVITMKSIVTVSYTHLTLPTNREV